MDRFFLYWTLKESYIKARGMGLALPLSAFSFELDSPGSGVRVQFDPSLADDPGRWHFSVLSYGRRHAIATGVEARGEDVRVVLRETVPLRSRPTLS
jgi:4'-phosphopantetheinyl transferase